MSRRSMFIITIATTAILLGIASPAFAGCQVCKYPDAQVLQKQCYPVEDRAGWRSGNTNCVNVTTQRCEYRNPGVSCTFACPMGTDPSTGCQLNGGGGDEPLYPDFW